MFISLRITRNPLSRRGGEGRWREGGRLSILTRYRGVKLFFTRCNLNSIYPTEKQRERESEGGGRGGRDTSRLFSFVRRNYVTLSETKVFKITPSNFTEGILEGIGYPRAKRILADDDRVFVLTRIKKSI